MADITQRHLNTQLEQYCQLNGGMYNYVQICDEHDIIPQNFDIDTIILQKQGKALVAYWHENGHVMEKALRAKNVQDIQKKLPQLGITQNRKLINKIVEKYECSSSPNLSFIESNGNCNGWSFLYPYYVSTGREQEFKALRKYIAKWKGNYEFEKLPIELRGQYHNGEEVFQQVINDLVWFQHSPDKLQLLYGGVAKKKLRQDDRKKQYSMLKLPGFMISDICYYGDRGIGDPATIRNENVIRVMEFYAQWPDSWIDFTLNVGGAHAVSAYITKDGKFKYYDSNNRDADVKELSARECIAAMEAEYAPYNLEVKVKGINLHKFHGPMVTEALNNHKEFTIYDPETARILLKNAFKLGQIEFAEFLLRDYITIERSAEFINQNRILTDINAETDKDMIKLLVRYGANVNQPVSDNGWTPLHIACSIGNGTIIPTLRRQGANLNAQDAYGATPIYYAAKSCSGRTLKYLISHGAEVTAIDPSGRTLLHQAAIAKNINAMREILETHQIDINAQDSNGNTALHYAVRMGMAEGAARINQSEIIKLLRHYKADLNIVNSNGEKPIEAASNQGAKVALAKRMLIRRDAMENMNTLNAPQVGRDQASRKIVHSASSSSSSSSSSSAASASSESESVRKRPTLLGSIPIGRVVTHSQWFADAMQDDIKPKKASPVSRSNVQAKKAFFEDKIQEQTKENRPVPTRPKKG